MRKSISICIFLLSASICLAQKDFSGIVSFSKTVHDFGDVAVDGGPVSCSFDVKNISAKPVAITSVVSSCGCTAVKWTREDIQPGKSGTISATYSNEDGPYPFDKTLTVYVSNIKKPIILHIRGVVQEQVQDAAVSYPVHYGPLALRSSCIKAGNMEQGEKRSGEMVVANIGESTIKLGFKDVSEGLQVASSELTIAPGALSRIIFTVTADRSRWGKNWYYATPVINGKVYRSTGTAKALPEALGVQAVVDEQNPVLKEGSEKIGFQATTIDNFSSMGRAERDRASVPDFRKSAVSFGSIDAGTRVKAIFSFTNKGQQPLHFHKIDSGSSRVKVQSFSQDTEAGQSGTICCSIDTRGLDKGEKLFIVNVYTNSPSHPVIYLYVSGIIR